MAIFPLPRNLPEFRYAAKYRPDPRSVFPHKSAFLALWIELRVAHISKDLTLTGRVEGDFEGGFTVVDNADVTSIRNPQPRLRLAFARLDYDSGEGTDGFFEGGQDWSLFGSTALPNILETTFLGAFSGDVWERTPQFRFGLVQNLGGSANFKLSPEFALMSRARLESINCRARRAMP